jgi:alpha-L-fucosidase
MSRLGPKQILLILLAPAVIIAGLSFGSYYFSAETLTARGGAG